MTQESNQKRSADALERLSELQRLGQELFGREAGRLARKHGLDDPRTQRMIRTASGAQKMLVALETARDLAPQEVSVAAGEIVVYGRVVYADLRGAAGVEVAIEDTNGRVMRAAGSATSDAGGRYTLRIPPAVAEKLAGKDYIITAHTTKGEVIYRAPTTIKLDLRQAVQVDVNLGPRATVRRPTVEPRRSRMVEAPEQPAEPAHADGQPQARQTAELVTYTIGGRILRADGKPAPGVLVRIYQDPQLASLLGAALTNRKGEFRARCRLQDVGAGEATAALSFVVVDVNEKELLSTVDQARFNADREAAVTLTIPV